MRESFDAVVIGAGVFGAWIAHCLRATGRSVALLDAYGAANSRASSGDETRILRMGYGADEIYTRWAMRSRGLWIELLHAAEQPELFRQTGILWTPPAGETRAAETRVVFEKCGVEFQEMTPQQLRTRYPQVRFRSERSGVFEPEGGVLLARRAVQQVVEAAVRNGMDYFRAAASAPEHGQVKTSAGGVLNAGVFVYACGPWLPKIFPQLLEGRIRPTRQEVFYFGTPSGDRSFGPDQMPVWLDFSDDRNPYALPDVENRGFKVAFDRHGPAFDPDTGDRVVAGSRGNSYLRERSGFRHWPGRRSSSRACANTRTPPTAIF